MKEEETILKEEFIKYFTEKYYSKFDKLCEIWSKEEIEIILNNNIRKIINKKKSLVYLGRYYVINKKIYLYNGKEKYETINIKEIEEDEKNRSVILHEMTHALFRKNIFRTGMFSANIGISTFKHYPRTVVKCRGLNEGLTNWIVEKCGVKTNTYNLETNIIKQLEIFLGEEKIIELGITKIKKIRNILGFKRKKFKMFYELVDDINYINLKLLKKYKKLNKLINLKNKNNTKEGKIEKRIDNINHKIFILKEKRKVKANKVEEIIYEKFILNASKEDKYKAYVLLKQYENFAEGKIIKTELLENELK